MYPELLYQRNFAPFSEEHDVEWLLLKLSFVASPLEERKCSPSIVKIKFTTKIKRTQSNSNKNRRETIEHRTISPEVQLKVSQEY